MQVGKRWKICAKGASIISMHYISNLICTSKSSNQNNPRDMGMMRITQSLTFRWSQSLFCNKLKHFNMQRHVLCNICSHISIVIPMHRRVHCFHDKFDSKQAQDRGNLTSKNSKTRNKQNIFQIFQIFENARNMQYETHI